MSRVYVGNLDPVVSEQDLKDEFGVHGVLISVWVARRPPGFAFVEFDDSKDALDAIRELDGKNGWFVKLDCNPQESAGGSPSGRRRRRSPEMNTSRKKIKKGMDVEPNKSLTEVSRKLYISKKKFQKYYDAPLTKIKEFVNQVSRKIYISREKVQKNNDVELTEFEKSVAQAFFDLENIIPELKTCLKDLYINSAVQIGVSEDCDAVAILYPYKFREGFRKIHLTLVTQLEKKFSGYDVVLVPVRRMVPQLHNLAAAHDVIVRDILYPAQILGQQVIYNFYHPIGKDIGPRADYVGKYDPLYPMCIKYFLDSEARNDTEHKREAFAGVFTFLCGKYVGFDYMVTKS